ncbi:extracellular solute-binding protein [Roseomonas sp. OT10]|uniref:extracellular solute-binding protein n=1 Tax=Roseomonas cutis TaxID=2897332 RepID=UPI001E4DC7E7|nr:extracellular solute-binding protein [Roseomonas sp. OT10]UFN48943.1 extracellular solute-binding protein [Roseomonas sp. OT10]
MMGTRRDVLAGGAGLLAAASGLARPALAQAPRRVVIMSHAVHQRVVTGAKGGDSTAAWRQANGGREIEWLTFGVEAVHERLYREAALAQGQVDVGFLLERYGGPHIAPLFEDLRPYMEAEPIEAIDEISPSMIAAHTYQGRWIGVPFRHATHGLFYNKALLEERGVAKVPESFEEVIQAAERLTFTRPDGTRVAGYATSMDDPSGIMDIIRAHGGDFITGDYKFVADQPAALQAITLLRDWYKRGVLPRNMMTFKTEEVITAMQQGRAALTNQPYGRFENYNDPRQSKYPGQIAVTPIPMLAAAAGKPGALVPAKTSVWAMGIPRNAPDKKLSWSLIRTISSRDNTIRAAVNGNGPVRMSAYDDPRVRELAPYSDAERRVLPIAKLVVPGFDQVGRAMDIFMEEVQKAMLGASEPAAAMRSAKARIEPLLPA